MCIIASSQHNLSLPCCFDTLFRLLSLYCCIFTRVWLFVIQQTCPEMPSAKDELTACVCVFLVSPFMCACVSVFSSQQGSICICASMLCRALILSWTLLASCDKQLPPFSLNSTELRTHTVSPTRPDCSTTWTDTHAQKRLLNNFMWKYKSHVNSLSDLFIHVSSREIHTYMNIWVFGHFIMATLNQVCIFKASLQLFKNSFIVKLNAERVMVLT